MSRLLKSLLVALAVVQSAPAANAAPKQESVTRPVKVVANDRLPVGPEAGSGLLPLYVSRDWRVPQPEIVHAVIVVHGQSRNADDYFEYTQQALVMVAQLYPGLLERTILVAPQFLNESATAAHNLPPEVLRWRRSEWEGG